MVELKPCKCGNEAHLQKTSRGKYWFECGACWQSSNKFWSIEEAVDDWDRRMDAYSLLYADMEEIIDALD